MNNIDISFLPNYVIYQKVPSKYTVGGLETEILCKKKCKIKKQISFQ